MSITVINKHYLFGLSKTNALRNIGAANTLNHSSCIFTQFTPGSPILNENYPAKFGKSLMKNEIEFNAKYGTGLRWGGGVTWYSCKLDLVVEYLSTQSEKIVQRIYNQGFLNKMQYFYSRLNPALTR